MQSMGSVAEHIVVAALNMHGVSYPPHQLIHEGKGNLHRVIGSDGPQRRHDSICGVAVTGEAHSALADM